MMMQLSREFVYVDEFDSRTKKLGFTSADYYNMEQILLLEPKKGAVMPYTNGLRKLRYSPTHSNAGKSGGCRIFYVDIESHHLIILVTLINKREADNLSDAECIYLGKFVSKLKELYIG
ncbi:addiction module toxin RelE [Paenilisteria weihenstephanensis]|nr:addiction module toxin RelE [Listeria weihenstephanensis]